jgi:hypothetical protein
VNEDLTKQLLEWLEPAPRSYRETMEAWRTSCPRLSIWEDALTDGLVEVVGSDAGSFVRLTKEGHFWLQSKT